jgi:hypothetical protein
MFSCSCSCVVALHLVWWCSVCTIAEVFSACFPRLGCGDGPQQEACTSIHLWSRAASAYSHDQTWQWVNDLNEADLGRACANKEILPCLIRGRDRRQLKTWRIWMKEGRQRGKVSLEYWGILRMGDTYRGGRKEGSPSGAFLAGLHLPRTDPSNLLHFCDSIQHLPGDTAAPVNSFSAI